MDSICAQKQNRSKMLARLGFIACFCFMISLALALNVHAETKKINATIRVGQKVQLSIKDVSKKLTWNVTKGSGRVTKKKKNGRYLALKRGKAVIKTVYKGDTYSFNITIKKKKTNQDKLVKVEASEETIVKPSKSKTSIPKANLTTKTLGVEYAEKNVIIVGDSRCVGMKSYVGGQATWIAEVSMGLSWLKSTAWKKLKKMSVKNKVIVFNLGVNDLGNASSYVSTMNNYGAKLMAKGASVYFMTVNPVDEKVEKKNGYVVKNSQIVTFNKKLASGLEGFGIIDTYDYLADNGFKTVDGVHYKADTYKTIYSVLSDAIIK